MSIATVIIVASIVNILFFGYRILRERRERRARIDEIILSARRQERDASLKSAARRLDAEWERNHGRPT